VPTIAPLAVRVMSGSTASVMVPTAAAGLRDRVTDRGGTVTEHPNVEQARRGYAAFATGDMATLAELMAPDVVWHVRGVGPLSGDYRGREQVFGFFGRLAEETGGTFRLDVHDILANDEHTAVLCTLTASRGNKSVEVPVVNVSHNRDGLITEFWAATTDPQANIDFWA
jgi:uncharacterized protein